MDQPFQYEDGGPSGLDLSPSAQNAKRARTEFDNNDMGFGGFGMVKARED